MGRRYEQTIRIDASPEAVFDYVADFARHPEWATNPLEVEVTSNGPVAEGSTFTSVGKLFGRHRDRGRVTEFERARRLVFETEGDVGTVLNWFTLEGSGGGTTVTKGQQVTRSSLLTKLTAPVVPVVVPRSLRQNLEAIKSRVEGAGTTSS